MVAPILIAMVCAMAGAGSGIEDARLNDVVFVDARQGWAVGDRGAIWHTDDAGASWQRQSSHVSCPLHAVWFHNERTGWAAGGLTRPYTHASQGVLLRTQDGGKTWSQVPQLKTPAIRRIGFFDSRRGWALGCRSSLFPSGVFVTSDGGEDWRPLPGDIGPGWMAGTFLDFRTGMLAGRNGSQANVRDGVIGQRRSEEFELRSYVQMQWSPGAPGWLVGDGGLVRTAARLNAVWHEPAGQLPVAVRYFDFAAVAVRGPNCWIAGNPGTRVFHTADAGRTWTAYDTGCRVPIRAMAFADDQHGWAVGELGVILATADGGRSWQRQRAGGLRAPLLGVFVDPEDVPLELFARLSGNEGYLSVVETLGRRDIELPERQPTPAAERLHEAVVGVGGCAATAAWRFPLRQRGLTAGSQQIVEIWDRAGDGHAMEELVGHLVRQIRTWRPAVLVTRDASSGDDPADGLVQKAIVRAVRDAADANAFAGQLVEAGLAPWQVQRVYAAMPPGARSTDELATSQFASMLGCTLADAAVEPRGLLADGYRPSPSMLGFRLTAGSLPEGAGRLDFFAGQSIAPGSDGRRALSRPAGRASNRPQSTAKRRRHVQAIIEKLGRDRRSPEQMLAQMNALIHELDAVSAGQVLFQLADQCHRMGRWEAAAESYQILLDRYPDHSLAPLASRWLLQYYASGEAAVRLQSSAGQRQKRLEQALALGRKLEQTQPERFAEPTVRFPLAAAYRGLGQSHEAERLYQLQYRADDRDGWWSTAQGELRADSAKSRSERPALVCVRTQKRPHLDGKFDDPAWKTAKPIPLRSAQGDDGGWPASVMLAHDGEFLYLAIRCRQPKEDNSYRQSPGPRSRDGDLSRYDRVELLLDVDRDYATYYRLGIDCRGWTNDRLWGDATWDPRWFVATGGTDGEWTAEAAIPLSQLVGEAPKPQDVWAIGVQRIVPGVGFQSWSTPAAVEVLPDGFGRLVFE